MKTAVVTLKSLSPYSQSRQHADEKEHKETHDAYEKRTWRSKAHATPDGHMFIPPTAFTQGMAAAAKFNPRKIEGRGKSTYTKHFRSGLMVTEGPVLDELVADVPGEWINANSDGVRGSGKRVQRCFPTIQSWGATVTFYVLDDTITADVFADTLREFGQFIGIGRFRPENGGFYGRFEAMRIAWEGAAADELAQAEAGAVQSAETVTQAA